VLFCCCHLVVRESAEIAVSLSVLVLKSLIRGIMSEAFAYPGMSLRGESWRMRASD